jgi:hypothetical protein
MAEAILQGVTRRTDYLYSLIDTKRTDPSTQAFTLDVLEGLRSCALLRDYLAETCKLLWKEAFEDLITDYNLAGKVFLSSVNLAQRAMEVVRERAAEARARGIPEEIVPRFEDAMTAYERAVADVQELNSDFSRRWPWLSDEKVVLSIAEEKQGTRRRSAKEVFDELRRRV